MKLKILMVLVLLGVTSKILVNLEWSKTKINQVILTQLNQESIKSFKIKDFEVNLFPLSIEFDFFEIEVGNEQVELESYARKITFVPHLFKSLISQRKNIFSLWLEQGKLNAKIKKSDIKAKDNKKDLKTELKKFYENFLKSKIQIDTITLNDFSTSINEYNAYIEKGSIQKNKKTFDLSLKINQIQNLHKLKFINLDATFDLKKIKINELELGSMISSIIAKGEILDHFGVGDLNLRFSGSLDIMDALGEKICNDFELSGLVDLKGIASNSITNPHINSSLNSIGFKSKYLDTDKLNLDLYFKDLVLGADRGEINKNGAIVTLDENQPLYDFNEHILFSKNLKLKFNNLSLRDGLRTIPNIAKMLDGTMNGGIELLINKEKVDVLIDANTNAENFIFQVDDFEVLKIKNFTIKDSIFSYNFLDDDLYMKIQSLPGSNFYLNVDGNVKKGFANIKSTNDTSIDLSNFEHIADFKVSGLANQKILFKGPVADSKLTLLGKGDSINFEGFELGNLDGKFIYNLKDQSIEALKLKGMLDEGSYTADGKYYLTKGDSNLKVKLEKLDVWSFKKFHGPTLSAIDDVYLEDVRGDFSGNYKISGFGGLETIKVNGFMYSENLDYLGEKFSRAFTRYAYHDDLFRTTSLNLQKEDGSIKGSLKYGLKDEEFIYKFKSDNLELLDLNNYNQFSTSFTSKVEFDLNGTLDDIGHVYKLKATLKNSKMVNKNVPNSKLELKVKDEQYLGEFNFLGDVLKGGGSIDLSSSNSISHVSVDTNISNWIEVFGLVLNYPSNYSPLEGKFKSSHRLDFKGAYLKELNYDGKIDELSMTHPEIMISAKKGTVLKIRNGIVDKFKIDLNSFNDFFKLQGSGNFLNKAKFKVDSNVSAFKISKVFNSTFNFGGNLKVNGATSYSDKKFSHRYRVFTDNFKINNLPFLMKFQGIELDASLVENKVILKKFQIPLGDGNLLVNASVNLNSIVPEVYAEYRFKNSKIKVNEKSFLTLSGKGSLVGDSKPYSLSGNLQVLNGKIEDEFESFMSESNSVVTSTKYKYLPKDPKKRARSWIDLNMSARTIKPVRVKNSMADMGVNGEINLIGNLDNYESTGNLQVDSFLNRTLSFNSTPINVSKLRVDFLPGESLYEPYIDFLGRSNISDYEVSITASGPVSNMRFDFNSDPYLNRTDILSLLAFGYAEDPTDRLGEQQRDNLSSVGISNLIFNQLKINNTLQKNFGVTVNVNTNFEEDEQSLLEGRSQTGGKSGDIKTTTRVEVQKKLSDKVNIAVSSSILDDTEQKQEVNINYQIKKNIQLKGVYEVDNDETGVNEDDGQSIGADLKFQWIFK